MSVDYLFEPDELREFRQQSKAALRLGHGGQGTPHGWTPQGLRLLRMAAVGRTKNCLACHEPIEPFKRGKRKGNRPAYHRGCSDIFYERYYRAWHLTKRIVWRRDDGHCRACGTTTPGPDGNGFVEFRWEYDHIIEIANGGDPLDPANVQLLCRACHLEKTRRFLSRPRYVVTPNQTRLSEFG